MGVAQFDDRVVLVSLAEVGGPLEPEGLDASMDELFQAAVTKAGGEITGGSGSRRTGRLRHHSTSRSRIGLPVRRRGVRGHRPGPDVEGVDPAGELLRR